MRGRGNRLVQFIAGAVAGMALFVVFIAVVPLMVFSLARDETHWAGAAIRRGNPTTMMLGLMMLAYPVCTLLGGLLGLAYEASLRQVPTSALGTGNVVYSLILALAAIALAAPAALTLRRVALGVIGLAAGFAASYAWLLPLLVEAAKR